MPYSKYLPEHMGSIKLLTPGPFVAGSYAELTLVYTAGTFGIDDTGMVKISWRTTSDMSKPQFDKPEARELHDGRGEQRRQARGLVRPPQHSPVRQHAADPRRPRLSARRRHTDDPARRPPARLARFAAADQRREQGRAAHLGRCFCGLRILRTAGAAGVRSGGRTGGELEGDPAVARGRGRAVPARHRRRGYVGQSDRGRGGARSRFESSLPLRGLPDSVTIRKGEGPRVIENLVADQRRRSRAEGDGRWPGSSRAPTRFAS